MRLDGSIRDPNALHMAMLEHVRRRADEFDFLHFHLDYYPFSLFARQRTPFVTTLHGRLDLPEHQPVFDTFSDAPVISISNSQRRPLPQARWIRTIHHGLPERLLMPQPVKPSYFAFLGRIAPEKRVDSAIRIAEHCGMPLKIAAKIDRADRDYYDEEIKPLMNSPHVEYIGEISDDEKSAFLSGAIALLVPIDWPEPFGLVMIEAMACGTPVIAFNRGSVPEVIEDGVTGFIVEDEAGAIGAVDRLSHLSRARDPRALREALHGAPHGARLSRGLSRADGRRGAAAALVVARASADRAPLRGAGPVSDGRPSLPTAGCRPPSSAASRASAPRRREGQRRDRRQARGTRPGCRTGRSDSRRASG